MEKCEANKIRKLLNEIENLERIIGFFKYQKLPRLYFDGTSSFGSAISLDESAMELLKEHYETSLIPLNKELLELK